MYQILKYLAVIILLVAGAVWLADNPGSASLDWGGYRVEAPFSVLLIALILFGVVCALLYRVWLFLRRTPGLIGESRRESRRRKGYLALTRGMVAVAAGDVNEAEKNAKQAENLLSDPPLTMLLSAQAAQLAGDETAAEKYFEAMAEKPEMAFLGLKGRLTQALKQNDKDTALSLARRAHKLSPKTDWANDTLFDLLVHKEQWTEAEALVRAALKNKLLQPSDANRRLALLLHEQAKIQGQDNNKLALKTARKALDLAPSFIPAGRHLAKILVQAKRLNKAEETLEELWAKAPQAPLVNQYLNIRPAENDILAIPKVERLANFNTTHEESAFARAEAALKAKLWGEARKYLEPFLAAPSIRVCRLMAELEEEENQDMAKSREWLRKTSSATPDPVWVCQSCGNMVNDWSPLCSKCQSFDSLEWHTPPSVLHLEKAPTAKGSTTTLPATTGASRQEVTQGVDVAPPGE
ncbi:MAG: tetratricopeptide repeat protein [Alphaproteobacteria bacterium]|nr:tetratricopeptide repeat protein [Alphaproteobacteria bacterium]